MVRSWGKDEIVCSDRANFTSLSVGSANNRKNRRKRQRSYWGDIVLVQVYDVICLLALWRFELFIFYFYFFILPTHQTAHSALCHVECPAWRERAAPRSTGNHVTRGRTVRLDPAPRRDSCDTRKPNYFLWPSRHVDPRYHVLGSVGVATGMVLLPHGF